MPPSSPFTGVTHNQLAWQLLQAVPDAVFLVDPESLIILAANSIAGELTGLSQDALVSQPFSSIFTLREGDLADILNADDSTSSLQPDLQVHLVAGSDGTGLLTATGRILETDGPRVGIIFVRNDASSEQLCRTLTVSADEPLPLLSSYPDSLLRISSTGVILERHGKSELAEFLGIQEAPSNQVLQHIFPAMTSRQVQSAIEKVASDNGQESVHFSVERDGEVREFEVRFQPLHSSADQIAILRDVTQLRKAELQIEHASEQFRHLFENSPDAIFVESPEGVVLDANQAACELHKLSREQLIGKDVVSLIPPSDRPAASKRATSLVTGEISEFESRSLKSDGESVPVGVRISTITYNGRLALLLHVRDITQQKVEEQRKRDHERQLAHVSRLTMMGQLVAGIAHEIRQPLWSLSTFADVCVESLIRPDLEERLPQIRDVARKVVSEARRVNAITTRMFSFARKGTPERTMCDIYEIVTNAVELTAGLARSNRVSTTLDIETGLPEIFCDQVLIEQTFANLLNNAYVALATHHSTERAVVVELHLDTEDGDYVTASVRDNGPGLPDGVVPEQLFEGFFTTGQSGLGIGLALSRSFVEDHGGVIRAEQLPEGGMEFVFTLRVDGGKEADGDRSLT